MKIVHSFWSKPILNPFGKNKKSIGGWRHRKYHYISWALSCLSFRKFYPEIELITDQKGKELLVDCLELPYDTVKIEMDCLNQYPNNLWAVGKIYAYSLQDKPFIHVDSDVFIWQRFEPQLENAELIAQHVDVEERHYKFGLDMLRKSDILVPKVIENDLAKYGKISVSNAGIIGGNNVDFFHEFAHQSFRFLNKNLKKIDESITGSSYALIYEQFLFSALARSKNIDVQHYIEDMNMPMEELTDFIRKYGPKKYVHLLADAKTRFEQCREMEMQLLLEYPEYHQRVLNLIGNNG